MNSTDILQEEKMSLLMYMKYRKNIALPPEVCRKKNIVDSVKYRKRGNELYNGELHDEQVHENIWKLYSQSIALAPNNSEELALGYGNRSALLFHLEKFEECIRDCDRSIAITASNFLKSKLLCRKAECLISLNRSSAKNVCEQALKLLDDLSLDYTVKSNFMNKLSTILITSNNVINQARSSKTKNYYDSLANFPRSEEIPCASQSIAIKYNKKWGKHIVATQDIKPGEMIAIEKNFYTFIYPDGMYLFCSNCTQYTWDSIPCEHCIYDVYCSESCRSEAWIKYHQFECPVYPYLWDIDQEISVCQCAIRLLLIAIHEAGGIDEMRKEITDIENCKDPRIKGFTEGIFRGDKMKSIYSMKSKISTVEPDMKFSLIEHTCTDIYFLANHTTFFGRKMNVLATKMFLNEDIFFIAALLLHTHYITPLNGVKMSYLYGTRAVSYAMYFNAFSSLINHSCDPNTYSYVGKDNKTIVYAIQPISKGSQLFICYSNHNFLNECKEGRQSYLQEAFDFTCNCLACTEDWSSLSLPSLEKLTQITPALHITIYRACKKLQVLLRLRSERHIVYKPKLMEDIVFYLNMLANKITVHCEDYHSCLTCLTKLFHDVFGFWIFDVPRECYIQH